jgi:DNA-binding PucR family transcriptional regulator
VGIAAQAPRLGSATLVALGPPRTVEELPASFAAAGRVLNACRAVGLTGIYDLAGAALFVTASESGDAGDALVDRYLTPLEGSASGSELVATLRAWQEMGMRTEAAAKRLHVHPNTLRYRLGRYEELTGVDLSETEEMVGLWLALARDQPGGSSNR